MKGFKDRDSAAANETAPFISFPCDDLQTFFLFTLLHQRLWPTPTIFFCKYDAEKKERNIRQVKLDHNRTQRTYSTSLRFQFHRKEILKSSSIENPNSNSSLNQSDTMWQVLTHFEDTSSHIRQAANQSDERKTHWMSLILVTSQDHKGGGAWTLQYEVQQSSHTQLMFTACLVCECVSWENLVSSPKVGGFFDSLFSKGHIKYFALFNY